METKGRLAFGRSKLVLGERVEKEMASHSCGLAWRIPGMTEPGGLPSLGSHRVDHDWSNLAAAGEWENEEWVLKDKRVLFGVM